MPEDARVDRVVLDVRGEVVVPRDARRGGRQAHVDAAVRIQPRQDRTSGTDDATQTARPVRIGRRGQERSPAGDSGGVGVAVCIGLANRSDRAPPPVVELAVPHRNRRVGHAHIDRREKACAIADVQPSARRQVAETSLERTESDVGEEARRLRLLRGSERTDAHAVVADFLELFDVQLGHDRRRRAWPELAGRLEHERLDLTQPSAEERGKRRRRGSPDTRRQRHVEHDRGEAPVVLSKLDDTLSGPLAVADALLLRHAVGDLPQRRLQRRVEVRRDRVAVDEVAEPKYSMRTPCAATAAAACGEAPFGAFASHLYSSCSPVIPLTAL